MAWMTSWPERNNSTNVVVAVVGCMIVTESVNHNTGYNVTTVVSDAMLPSLATHQYSTHVR